MAVIAEKTIGNTLYQTGDAVPTHNAPSGSIFILSTPGTDSEMFVNNEGGNSSWNRVPYAFYGGMYIQDNTTFTNLDNGGAWTEISNLTFKGHLNQLVGIQNPRLVPSASFGSQLCQVTLSATITKAAGESTEISNYDVGVSLNSANPISGMWGTATVSDSTDTKDYDIVSFTWIQEFSGNNTISIAARMRGFTTNFRMILRNAYLFVNKIR